MGSFSSILLLILSTTNFGRLSNAEERSPSYIDESLSFILLKLSDIEQKVGKVDQRLNEISMTVTVTMQHLLAQSSKEEKTRISMDKISQKVEELYTSHQDTRTELKTLTKTSEESLTLQKEISKLDWKSPGNTKTSQETSDFESGIITISTGIQKLSDSQGELASKLEGHISWENQKVNNNVEKLLKIVGTKPTCREVMDNWKNFNKTLLENQKTLMENQMKIMRKKKRIEDHNSQNFQNNTNTEQPHSNNTFENCVDTTKSNFPEGIYKLHIPQSSLEPFEVFCIHNGLTAILRHNGSIKFSRSWNEFKHGFGDLYGDFWLGLEKIEALTSQGRHKLWIKVDTFTEKSLFLEYSDFKIGSEKDGYYLKRVGNFTGGFEDILGKASTEKKFMTYDRIGDCADRFLGPWWYKNCSFGNINRQINTANNTRKFNFRIIFMAIKPVT